MDQHLINASLLAFCVAVVCLWVFEPVARHIGLVDHPGGRKVHENPTPLIGGVAMFVAFAFAILLVDASLFPYRTLFAGALLLMVVGLMDDLQEISATARIGAEIVAALIMAIGGGVYLASLGHIWLGDSEVGLGILAVPLTVFATVAVINAMNMVDGIDGLAGSLALVAIAALALLAWMGGNLLAATILSILASAVVAFLTSNLRLHGHGLVYMGDAGSMFLGLMIAWFTIDLSQGAERVMNPVTALWVFALPLMDTATVVVKRIARGDPPFSADRTHCHHLLMRLGFSPKQTLLIMAAFAALLAAIGVAGDLARASEFVMLLAILALYAVYVGTLLFVERLTDRVNQPSRPPQPAALSGLDAKH